MLYGWIPLTPATAEKQHWGGHLALAREVHALPDGSLATRLAPEIAKVIDKLVWKPHRHDSPVLIESCEKLGASLTISPPHEQTFRLRMAPLGLVEFSKDQIRICDASGASWSSLQVRWHGEISIRVFVEEDRVEVFAGDRYSLCARLPKAPPPLKLTWEGPAPREIRTSQLHTSP